MPFTLSQQEEYFNSGKPVGLDLTSGMLVYACGSTHYCDVLMANSCSCFSFFFLPVKVNQYYPGMKVFGTTTE